MQGREQACNSLFHVASRRRTTPLVMAIVFALTAMLTAQAQTFQILHNFTSGDDGALPQTGLTQDAAGNFYATTWYGGSPANMGTVFRLSHRGSDWVLNTLYAFQGQSDGGQPTAKVVLAPDRTLYSTTSTGGEGPCQGGCGTVFRLRPSPTTRNSTLTAWNETVLNSFNDGSDGGDPWQGNLTFDQSGNIYGTTYSGGTNNNGVIYELTSSGGGWTETTLYSAQGPPDGAEPIGGVVFDQLGNLYGVFNQGGPYNAGAIYKLAPSGSSWTEQILYSFTGGEDGRLPTGLIIDSSGRLFGGTTWGGSNGSGAVFELTPSDGGAWTFRTIYSFPNGLDGPFTKLSMDAAGNLYGTTFLDGAYGCGNVFKLTPSNGGWTYTSIHDFTGGTDGLRPQSDIVFDSSGNLYGTANQGGAYGWGVIWEITP